MVNVKVRVRDSLQAGGALQDGMVQQEMQEKLKVHVCDSTCRTQIYECNNINSYCWHQNNLRNRSIGRWKDGP